MDSCSSRRVAGLRVSAPQMPALVRQWRPIITFSSTVMSLNRRMFWKVRAMPSAVMRWGLRPLSRCFSPLAPYRCTVPSVGL